MLIGHEVLSRKIKLIARALHFILRHPISASKYMCNYRAIWCSYKDLLLYFIAEDDVYNLVQLIPTRAIVEEFLHRAKKSCIPIIQKAQKIWEKADPSKMRFKGVLLYVLTRIIKPTIVVETGVASGVSTLFFLQALEDNDFGELYSIDLPNVENESRLPPGHQPGWIVPYKLKKKWHLILGDAKEMLPSLLERLGRIDFFLHDSLHTYDHMLWEFETAWPYIRDGGVLVSDDVNANTAFNDFIARRKSRYLITALGMGIAVKNSSETK